MSGNNTSSLTWLFAAILIACAAYVTYGTATAAAAYVLVYLVMGLCLILAIIPFIGVFIGCGAAIYAGKSILIYAGLATGTLLFNCILVYTIIMGILICVLTTIAFMAWWFD